MRKTLDKLIKKEAKNKRISIVKRVENLGKFVFPSNYFFFSEPYKQDNTNITLSPQDFVNGLENIMNTNNPIYYSGNNNKDNYKK